VHVNCGAALRCVSEFRSLSLAKQRSAAATWWVFGPGPTGCFETYVHVRARKLNIKL
jgi:hypothetical protein